MAMVSLLKISSISASTLSRASHCGHTLSCVWSQVLLKHLSFASLSANVLQWSATVLDLDTWTWKQRL
jgi:hypothetical protein